MHMRILCFGFLVGASLVVGCSTPGPGEFARDFEVFYEDGELDTVTYEDDNPETGSATKVDVNVERERYGARFAFGGESVRGFFQVFGEEWKVGGEPGLDLYGAGGGVKGAPVISEVSQDIVLIIPYRADLSVAIGGDESSTITTRDLGYVELQGEVGFGMDWMGLRPSIGLATSSLGGFYEEGAFYLFPGETYNLSAFNAGFYIDLLYKHADFPLYGHIRALMGDYQATTFGIGAKF